MTKLGSIYGLVAGSAHTTTSAVDNCMKAMNKTALLRAIVTKLQGELNTAIKASQIAHESATHSENIAENKYDTLGLEAAYLAHGQSLRIVELQTAISVLETFRCPKFSPESAIMAGALVCLLDDNEHQRLIFISPSTGAMSLIFEGQLVQVISQAAPLGQALDRKHCGDELALCINNDWQGYEVIAVH